MLQLLELPSRYPPFAELSRCTTIQKGLKAAYMGSLGASTVGKYMRSPAAQLGACCSVLCPIPVITSLWRHPIILIECPSTATRQHSVAFISDTPPECFCTEDSMVWSRRLHPLGYSQPLYTVSES